MTNSQRPSSAYYPNPLTQNSMGRLPLHQSIPNLKSPSQEPRAAFPMVAHQMQQSYGMNPNYSGPPGMNYHQNQTYQNQNYRPQKQNYDRVNQYGGEPQNYINTNYPRHQQQVQHQQHDENRQYPMYAGQRSENSYPSPTMPAPTYQPTNLHQPLHINASGQRTDDINRPQDTRYSSGLLQEDYRHAQELQTQQSKVQESMGRQEDFTRNNEIRVSKSEDMLRQYAGNQNEQLRYTSIGNIKIQDKDMQKTATDTYQQQSRTNHDDSKEDIRPMNNLRGQAKLAEMSEEVRRRQNRTLPSQFHSPNNIYYQQQQQQQYYSPQGHPNTQQSYTSSHLQNTQSMQNLSLSQNYSLIQNYPGSSFTNHTQFQEKTPHSYHQNQPTPNYQSPNQHYSGSMQGFTSNQQQQSYYNSGQNVPASPNYVKTPPVTLKPKKGDDVPDLPPTSTHPLYSASSQDPPKMSLYTAASAVTKTHRDPWAREEQERQAEIRREQARILREQQIKELLSIQNRTQQQEEHLRVLQLEKEFQRRVMEEPEQEEEDTEKVHCICVSPSSDKYTKPFFTHRRIR